MWPYGYNPTRPYTLQSLRPCGAPPFTQGRLCGGCRGEHCSPAGACVAAKLHGRTLFAPTRVNGSPLRGAPAQRVRGGREGRNRHPATPQSPAVPPLTRPGPSVAARHLPTLWGVTPQGEPSSMATRFDPSGAKFWVGVGADSISARGVWRRRGILAGAHCAPLRSPRGWM